MKKIILIVCVLISCVNIKAQWIDTIAVTGITGNDTIICGTLGKDFNVGGPWSMDVDYSLLDADDGTFGILVANFDSTVYYYYSDMPYPLNVTANSYTNEHGNTKASKLWGDDYFIFTKLCYKFTVGSNTEGNVVIKFRQK